VPVWVSPGLEGGNEEEEKVAGGMASADRQERRLRRGPPGEENLGLGSRLPSTKRGGSDSGLQAFVLSIPSLAGSRVRLCADGVQAGASRGARRLEDSGDYPPDAFSEKQRKDGAWTLHFFGALYMFLALSVRVGGVGGGRRELERVGKGGECGADSWL